MNTKKGAASTQRIIKNLGVLNFTFTGILAMFLVLSMNVNAYDVQPGGTCYCYNCSDCENALNDNINCYSTVKLNKTIINQTGTCINNPANFSYKIFDCQGNIIDGTWKQLSHGIYLSGKSRNVIKNCIITEFWYGISLSYSPNNTIINNTVNSNRYGVSFGAFSNNNLLRNNTMNDNQYNLHIVSCMGCNTSYYYQDIDASNTVDSRSIFYWTNEKNAPNSCKNTEINELNNTGFVALISCENITIKNLNLFNNSHGILLVNTTNSRISNNTANNNEWGVWIDSSSYNNISNNTANSNVAGILLSSATNNILTNNTANSNIDGIYLWSSPNNILISTKTNNNALRGIRLVSSNNNTLANNTANSNVMYGICLHYSSNNNMVGNILNLNKGNGIGIIANSNFNKILNNKISKNNGTGISISNCDAWGYCHINGGNLNNTIEGNEILNNKVGIFSNASNSTINNNYVCGNAQDFNSTNWLSSVGDNNYCENAGKWNDTNAKGCKNTCKAKDIFDLVETLEYLNGDKDLKYPLYFDLDKNEKVNLSDVFALINKIVIQN